MLRKMMAALLAAAAFAPAMAQDDPGRDRPHGGFSHRGEARQPTQNGGEDRGPRPARPVEARQPPAFRPEPQRQPDQPRPAFQPQAQAQAQQQPAWRGYGDRGARGDRFAERAQRQQADEQARANGGFGGRGFTRPDGRGDLRPSQDRNRPIVSGNGRDDARRFDGQRRGEDQRRVDNQWRAGEQRRFDDGRRDGDRPGYAQRYGATNYAWNGRNDWSRRWRDDNRYDWGRYRQQNRALFYLPRYDAPYGWRYGYRRFSVGVRLSSLLWTEDYWIDDPWEYRLPPPYGPYRWVRYYNDALLVDLETGEVVDTVYDIFY